MLSLRTLNAAVVLAQEANFSRAADRLGLTQPALSRSIAKLERDCGLKLFERSRAGVVATSAGQELLAKARRLLSEAQAIEQDLVLQSRGEGGRLKMGMGPLASSVILPRLLAEIVVRWPRLTVATSIAPTGMLIEQILDGDADFCICSQNTLQANHLLRVSRVADLKMGYFVRAGHPLLAVPAPVPAPLFSDFPRASGSLPAAFGPATTGVFGGAGPTLQCDDFGVLRQVTLDSDTIWLANARMLGDDLDAGQLVELSVGEKPASLSARLVLVRLRDRTLLPATRQVIDLATSIY